MRAVHFGRSGIGNRSHDGIMGPNLWRGDTHTSSVFHKGLGPTHVVVMEMGLLGNIWSEKDMMDWFWIFRRLRDVSKKSGYPR